MLHIMLDAYNTVNNSMLNDLKYTYDSFVQICDSLNLNRITPPILVPYYYGSVQEDDGISTYVLLQGGHLTFHSFPYRACYFVDVFCQEYISDENFIKQFNLYFPYSKHILNNVDRRLDVEKQLSEKHDVNSNIDFGPHYLMETVGELDLNIDKIFHILDRLPKNINMDPIMRPFVVTDKINNYEFISGLTVIAQSHISIHYAIKEKKAYIDIFSCSFLKGERFKEELEKELGVEIKSTLISRGNKHQNQISLRNNMIEMYKSWEKNIE